ncbi:hypothetical protein [Oscillatoria acuminata]|uniref:Uncharacterized protein n=1 Tax=Oscillatoria acuminata PCC 6304 TaxID=56110 RepID=K9TSJ8_9CYAN|nr:hypothetical protein [Oscillatoria acuminata]AFY85530.1 hypothetical protein Oscil6304_6075 [Oscillatoria acuminata PCC 6304]
MMTPFGGSYLEIEEDLPDLPDSPDDTSNLPDLLNPPPLKTDPAPTVKPSVNPARLWLIIGTIGVGLAVSAIAQNQPQLSQISLPQFNPQTGQQTAQKPICPEGGESLGCIPLPALDPAEMRRNELLAKTLIETSMQQTAIDRARRDNLLALFAPNHKEGDYTPLDIKLVREMARQSQNLRELGQFEYSGEASIIDIPRVYNSDARAVVLAALSRIGEQSLVQSFLAQQLQTLTNELNDILAPTMGEVTDSNRATFERLSSEIDAVNDAIRASAGGNTPEPINLAYLASLMEQLTLESANQLSREDYMRLRMEARQQAITEEMERQKQLQEIERIRQQSGIALPSRSRSVSERESPTGGPPDEPN